MLIKEQQYNFEKQSTTLLYKEDRLSQLEEDKTYLKRRIRTGCIRIT